MPLRQLQKARRTTAPFIQLRICSSCRASLRSNPRLLSSLSSRPDPQSSVALSRPSHLRLARHLNIPSRSYATESSRQSRLHNASDSTANLRPERRLVVLKMPAMQRQTSLSESIAVDKDHLANLTQTLQTFEFEVQSEEVPNEIVLFKPLKLRVSKSRFDQIFKELSTAFLGPQLREYLSTTDLTGFHIYKLKKRDAINVVMRHVWKVEVAEEIAAEMDVIREKELSFTRIDLFFMMAEGGQLLQKLATRNRTRIVINSQKNTIILRGTQPSIEKVENSLRDLPSRVVSQELDLAPLKRVGVINENYLPGISRLTTVFMDTIDENKMTLYGLIPYGSTNILDAKRLLYTSFDLHFRETYSLLSETQATESMTGAVYPVSENQCLPWMYRNADWYRWRGIREPVRWADDMKEPVGGGDDWLSSPLLSPLEGAKLNYDGLRGLLDAPSAETTGTTPNSQIPPGAEVYTTYHAILGQIIHNSSTPPTRAPQNLGAFLSTNPSRLLCNSVPRLIDFLGTLNPVTFRYEFTIFLKFSPSPWANPDSFEHLPRVEMEIRIDPQTNEVKALRVSAVESQNITDVLMPRNTLDVRFVRKRLARIESKTSHIKKYIREAQLDVMGDERLSAGEELILDLPAWMVKDIENKPAPLESSVDSMEEPSSSSSSSTIPITYYFTGLETRSSTIFDYQGAPLVYTKVEAGTSGGSYDEVILECQKEDIEYLTPSEERQLRWGDDDDDLRQDKDGLDYGGLEDRKQPSREHWMAAFSNRELEDPLRDEESKTSTFEDQLETLEEREQEANNLINMLRPARIPQTSAAEEEGAAPSGAEEEEEAEEFISDEVFQSFVNTARNLVDAVEDVESAKNRRRRL